jgi:hypothetical protein
MDRMGEPYSLALIPLVIQHILNYTEQTFSTRDGKHHRTNFTQKPMPLVNRIEVLGGVYQVKDFKEAGHSVSRQFHGHSDSIDHPSQNNFPSGPSCVSFQHLLD